jgi:CMP/dCMP kinase
VARRLADSLGYRYLDTGAMYRGIAFAHRKAGAEDMGEFLSAIRLSFLFESTTRVFLDGTDISEGIRTPEISLLASSLSQDGLVRTYLTEKQREVGLSGGIVVEGRDTGSVVFPHADLKFYLDADIAERAKRRHLEMAGQESDADRERVRKEIEKRDRDDSHRRLAPLRKPADAVVIDTTGKTIEEVVSLMERHVRKAESR